MDREAYEQHGFATLPLQPGSKRPTPGARNWQTRTPDDLWRNAPPDCNLGLRCGDAGMTALDCDDPRTSDCALRTLEGLGLCTPTGELTRRGLHLLLQVLDVPEGFTYAPFSPDDWKGELRARQCYVVAPPSTVDGFAYTGFGDIRAVPVVHWRDVQWLVREQTKETHFTSDKTQPKSNPKTVSDMTHLARGPMHGAGLRLAEAIRQAADGASVEGFRRTYATRSEGLCALWRQCLQAGMTPEQAAALVGPIAGRTLSDLAIDARRVYGKVLATRRPYADLARQAATFTFEGRADSVRGQAKVLRAAALLAEEKGGGYLLHGAEVAMLAGLPRQSTVRTLARLVEAGYMRRGRRGRWAGFYVNAGGEA